jgi:Hemerythrin HHE cation binding domain
MAGPIAQHMEEDHARLDALLARAVATPGEVDRAAFDAFRGGLLRHIALEEKILFPAMRSAGGDEAVPQARRLRVDHGALAALLVPTPTPGIAGEIRTILGRHNQLEEGEGGLYAAADALLSAEAGALLERLRAYPPVRVAAHRDGPRVCRTAEEALRVSALQAERLR